jgi:hypothetical protein
MTDTSDAENMKAKKRTQIVKNLSARFTGKIKVSPEKTERLQ